jgi:glycosyltransferase involved in cell wall biosynthesis
MRLLLITGMWPTADRPAAGTFVVDRARGVPDLTVVGPRRHGGWWLRGYLRLALDAARARGPFDGIEAHGLYPAGIIGLVLARWRGVPLVVYAHGTDARRAASGRRLAARLARRVAQRADGVVTNSGDTARHLRALGREPLIIPPGIDLSRFGPSPRPPDRRVLYLGGRSPTKGYEVARQVADTIAGPGLREVAPAEVPALIRAHDVVLVPSLEEGFGVVAAEAVASGRWVVASSVGGLREVVEDGVNGTLVSDGRFAEAIARVPDYDPATVARTAARFDLAVHQNAMRRLWEELLAGRKGPDPAGRGLTARR